MEITSGGTAGPQFDWRRYDLENNLYGSLPGTSDPRAVAEAFHRAGWRARKSAWDEYEIEQEWAELNLVPAGERVRFSGTVVPQNLQTLLTLLTDLGYAYTAEYYDQDGELIATYANPGADQH